MGKIQVLAAEVSQKIAAGEVIERPASVVKEACENALDSGARRVDVELREGGLAEIVIRDDGSGMDWDDALLAFSRHATSKLRSFEDLGALQTLGFRGEALPSMAAVGLVELITRPLEQAEATRVVLEPGQPPRREICAGAPGTTLMVRELFRDLPARRAALAQPGHEAALCAETVLALALARPDVAFSVRQDGREALATPGDGELLSACVAVWGSQAGSLLPVSGREQGWEISGLVGSPNFTRGNRSLQFLSVDGRPVRSEPLRGAIEAAYANLLQVRRHPVFVLRLTAGPGLYDANVHPSKREVRIYQPERVRRACHLAVRATLGRANLIPPLPLGPSRETEPDTLPRRDPLPAPLFAEGSGGAPGGDWQSRESAAPWLPPAAEPGRRLPELTPLGQVARSYLVAAGPAGLYVVDQHAAHERVFFEALERADHAAQLLLQPAVVHLSGQERTRWRELHAALEGAGLQSEEFGGGDVLIRAVPAGLEGDPAAALVWILGRWEAGPDELTAARRALAACKAAIKAGMALPPGEQQALLQALAACRDPFTCPHGRPTVLEMGLAQLERHFGRR